MDVTFEGNTKTGTDEWLTPPYIIEALGEFDLDPCSPINRPWDTAKKHYNVDDNGLMQDWGGQSQRVWCNPPYDTKVNGAFLEKCALHGNAMVLIFARTETGNFFNYIWPHADAIFFIQGRLSFHKVTGEKGGSAGAPSVLIAYGEENVKALQNTKLKGKFIKLK